MKSDTNASLGVCAKLFAEKGPADHSVGVGGKGPPIPLGW